MEMVIVGTHPRSKKYLPGWVTKKPIVHQEPQQQ